MRLMSFSETTDQIRARTKTVTRRDGWDNLRPGERLWAVEKAMGLRKGQKVLGMTIVEGVKKSADEPHWDGGTIVDPNNGKSYKVRMTPKDGGKVLEVRGFIGPFYRNQQWIRVE